MRTVDTGRPKQAVIDHIVFGCDQLDSGTAYLEGMLAASFSAGGPHQMMETHTRLFRLPTSLYS